MKKDLIFWFGCYTMEPLALVFENSFRATLEVEGKKISINGEDHFLRCDGAFSIGENPEGIEPLFAVLKNGVIHIVFILCSNLLIATISPSGEVVFLTARSKERTTTGDVATPEMILQRNGVIVDAIFNGVEGTLTKGGIFEWEVYEPGVGFVAAILLGDGVHLSLSFNDVEKSAMVSDIAQQVGDARNEDAEIIGTFFCEEGAFIATSNVDLDEIENLYASALASRQQNSPIVASCKVKYWVWRLNTLDLSFANVLEGGWDATVPFGEVDATITFLEKGPDGQPPAAAPDRRDHLFFNEVGEISEVRVNYETQSFSVEFIDWK